MAAEGEAKGTVFSGDAALDQKDESPLAGVKGRSGDGDGGSGATLREYLTMVLEGKVAEVSAEVGQESSSLSSLSSRTAAMWVSAPTIKAHLCTTAPASSSPVSPVTTTDTDSESDNDVEKNEAASILSRVVNPEAQSAAEPAKMDVDAPPKEEVPLVAVGGPASSSAAAQYEDLLDCLASLASGRAHMEPTNQRVARMSVDDIDVRSSAATTATSSPAVSSPKTAMEEVMEALPPRRQRAVSNPEGCEVWRRIELAAKKADEEQAKGAAAGAAAAGGAVVSTSSLPSASVATPTLPHMLAKYASIYNKGGRIGIYTREERDAIIQRFREKKTRRVWAKKIRYTCRKSLADKRIRVKGRFVKLEDMEAILQQQEKEKAAAAAKAAGSLDLLTMIAERSAEDDEDEDEERGMMEEEEEVEEVPPAGKRMRRHSIAF